MHKVTAQFNGGIAQNSKHFLPNSARFTKNLNPYLDDDSVTLNPGAVKVSGAIVTDLIKWITDVSPSSTDKYGYGNTGNIYKITSSDVFTVDRTVSGGAGQGLGYLPDALYYATSTTLGRKYPLSGTPAYDDDFLTNGTDNLDLSVTASSNTYAPPVAISEVATSTLSFTPTKDPLKTMQLYVTAKGTGNWTVTVHDSANNSLGTATVANGSLTNGAMNDFPFSTPVRINIGTAYHAHVTSTVADGTLQTALASDLSSAQYKTFFGILITDALYHPIAQHTNGVGGMIVIGNGSYIAEYTAAGAYSPNKIAIRPGYAVRFFARENEFIVAYAWKGTTIGAFEEGIAFYWDGISPYYNYSIPVTGGSPNAGINFKNRMLTVHGTNGQLSLGTQPFRAIQPAPFLAQGTSIEVLPGAITVWQNRAQIGIGANSTDGTALYQGVYEYGNQSDRMVSADSVSSEVLSLGYTISTGDVHGTTMQISCVYAQGDALYIAWKSEAGTYGVDKVSKTGNPAAAGSWESLIDDNGFLAGLFISAPQKQKEAKTLVIKYNTLPTGCTVTPKVKYDRSATWTYGTAEEIGVAGSTFCTMQLDTRYYEIEYGFDLTATTQYPFITGLYFSFNPLIEERNFGQ